MNRYTAKAIAIVAMPGIVIVAIVFNWPVDAVVFGFFILLVLIG